MIPLLSRRGHRRPLNSSNRPGNACCSRESILELIKDRGISSGIDGEPRVHYTRDVDSTERGVGGR